MKDFIKRLLRENLLDELRTTQKSCFGAGCYHKVYASSQNPNRLYKMGKKDVVEEWVKIFNAAPNLFPKIYRVFPSKKTPNHFIVEIEKLDTSQAEIDFDIVARVCGSFNATIPRDTSGTIYLSQMDETKLSTLVRFIKQRGEERGDSPQEIHELINLVTKWCEYLMIITPLILDNKGHTDFHNENFGYDDDGNIKAIDV